MATKTNKGLVAYAQAQLGKPYWYGCFGNISTKALYTSKKKQYPAQYQWACPANQLNIRVHDCVGLIKGYLWSDTPTSTPKYTASQDVSANGMLDKCKEKGAIGTMPDIPGILVFLPGHVGVYIGNGEVIEAKGHAYGVVKTKLAGRGWKNWGKCPYLEYEKETPAPSTPAKPATPAAPKPAKPATTVSKVTAPTFKVGSKYVTQVDGLNVRVDAGTNYARKTLSHLTADGRKHADDNGRLKKGTTVTVKAIKKVGNDIWVKIPSGWIAAYYEGKIYLK